MDSARYLCIRHPSQLIAHRSEVGRYFEEGDSGHIFFVTNNNMKKTGTTLLILAALSLFGSLISMGYDADTAGGRFMGAIVLGVIGVTLLCIGNKKEEVSGTYWQNYKRLNPISARAIEAITEREMELESDEDAKQLVSSLERWSYNLGCEIGQLKTEFLKSFKSTFNQDEIQTALARIKNHECDKEANTFQIKTKNTCSFFMLQWLEEDSQKLSTDTPKLQSRNKMSARELVERENAKLEFIEKAETKKIYFSCGNVKGYVSPAASKKVETGNIDDFLYVEVSTDGQTYTPCLILASSKSVIRTFYSDNSTDKYISPINVASEELNAKKVRCRNTMTLRGLMNQENAKLDFIEDSKIGKVSFSCGNVKGYVSKAATEKIEAGSLDDFSYAEISIDNHEYIPCIMLARKEFGNKVVRTLSVDRDLED